MLIFMRFLEVDCITVFYIVIVSKVLTAMEIRVNYDSFLHYPWHLMLSDMAVLNHTLLHCFCMF